MLRPSTALLMLLAAPAFAQAFYRWVDATGTTHYTDDASTIPKGATVFATEGEPISEMGKPGPVPVAPKPAAVVEPRQADGDPSVPTNSEQYWRGQFRTARDKIHTLEDDIAADRHRVEDSNGMAVGVNYACSPGYGYFPQNRGYTGSLVVGPQGAQVNFGPVPQAGYVNVGSCIQTINPEYDRVRARLEKNRGALERAKEELHELERRASFEAVPLEWRR